MKLKKIFTTLLVLLPILSLYFVPGTKFLFFEVIIIGLFPFMFFSILKRNDIVNKILYYPLLIPLIYITLHFFVLIFIYSTEINVNPILLRTLHNIFYLFTAIFFVKQYFDIEFGIKVLKITAVVSSIYIIAQSVLISTVGFYLPGTLPFIETIVDKFNETAAATGVDIRPRSFFSEPSAYGVYIALYLIIDLFSGKKRMKLDEFTPNIIATIGLLLSRSSTSYLLGIAIWASWGLNIYLRSPLRNKGKLLLVSVMIIPILLYYVIQTRSFGIFVEHTFGSGNGTLGIGVMNRISNYNFAFSIEGISTFEILFGQGMKDLEYYLPGIPRMYYYFGIVGSLIWCSIYIYIYCFSNWAQRRVLLLMIGISFFGDSLFGISYLIYFPFIITLVSNKSMVFDNKFKINKKVEYK